MARFSSPPCPGQRFIARVVGLPATGRADLLYNYRAVGLGQRDGDDPRLPYGLGTTVDGYWRPTTASIDASDVASAGSSGCSSAIPDSTACSSSSGSSDVAWDSSPISSVVATD